MCFTWTIEVKLYIFRPKSDEYFSNTDPNGSPFSEDSEKDEEYWESKGDDGFWEDD